MIRYPLISVLLWALLVTVLAVTLYHAARTRGYEDGKEAIRIYELEQEVAWQRAKYDELLDRAVVLQRENERLLKQPPLVKTPWRGHDATVWAIPNLPPRGEPIGR